MMENRLRSGGSVPEQMVPVVDVVRVGRVGVAAGGVDVVPAAVLAGDVADAVGPVVGTDVKDCGRSRERSHREGRGLLEKV